MHVGVMVSDKSSIEAVNGIPHACGGDPEVGQRLNDLHLYSSYMWG